MVGSCEEREVVMVVAVLECVTVRKDAGQDERVRSEECVSGSTQSDSHCPFSQYQADAAPDNSGLEPDWCDHSPACRGAQVAGGAPSLPTILNT